MAALHHLRYTVQLEVRVQLPKDIIPACLNSLFFSLVAVLQPLTRFKVDHLSPQGSTSLALDGPEAIGAVGVIVGRIWGRNGHVAPCGNDQCLSALCNRKERPH